MLSEVRKDGEISDESKGPSYVMDYFPASPMTWRQVMQVGEGMNYYGLFIKDGSIRKDDDDQSKEKYLTTFRNVNISAVFISEYYGPLGK